MASAWRQPRPTARYSRYAARREKGLFQDFFTESTVRKRLASVEAPTLVILHLRVDQPLHLTGTTYRREALLTVVGLVTIVFLLVRLIPGDPVEAILGDPGHRWLTAQGPYSGDTASLEVFSSSGGVFDAAEPAAGQEDVLRRGRRRQEHEGDL